MFGFRPTPIQHTLADIAADSAKMIIVEDATGAGKTEASLIYALNCLSETETTGITFALPTRSTSNLMFLRMNSYADSILSENNSVTLQHGTSKTFLQTEGLEPEHSWVCGKNKALFANISVCTVDQALSAVIPTRYQPLKLISLLRHVVIIDEVHAYDPYMFRLLCSLVQYCKLYSIPLVLLSATIPSRMRKELIEAYGSEHTELRGEYPLITVCSGKEVSQIPCECSTRSIREIQLRYVSDENLVNKELTDLAKLGYRVCWIRNTVDDAIEAFNNIPDGEYEKLLVHSRFTVQDRTDIEHHLIDLCGKKSKPKGLIVISTQVVEQSLDIEFERVYSDLAPVDSLIQRMGRDQRFCDSPIPCEFVVHGPPLNKEIDENWYSDYFTRAGYVYTDHCMLYNTALLMSRPKISIPADYREFIEFAYSEPDENSPFLENHRKFRESCSASVSNSQRVILDPDLGYGNSLSEEFTDNQWDAIEKATTRETDDRTVQCLLMVEGENGPAPISGSLETSLITLKKKYVPSPETDDCLYYGKWRYTGKLKLDLVSDGKGNQYWVAPGIRYSRRKGAEYV